MNITTLETAIALKDAGFPQPQKQDGQIWYDGEGNRWFVSTLPIIVNFEAQSLFVNCLENDNWDLIKGTEGFIFAPTATDILKELGNEYNLVYSENTFYVRIIDYKDIVQRLREGSENPAEAAAQAWIHKNKK